MVERFELFTTLVAELARNIHRIKTAEMSEFALRGSHVSCLYYLYKGGAMTATELCDRSGEDKANVSRAVASLEKSGYLTCPSSGKRYQSPLSLTEKGRSVGARIAEKVDGVLARAGEGLSEEDRAVMYRSMKLVRDNLRKIADSEH